MRSSKRRKEGASTNISEDFLTACKSKDFTEFLELQKTSWRAARPGFDGELFCICQTPYDDDQEYIGCEGVCDGWFHIECVGISKKKFKEMSRPGYSEPWHCDDCKKRMRCL
jgi:hypothetical protein